MLPCYPGFSASDAQYTWSSYSDCHHLIHSSYFIFLDIKNENDVTIGAALNSSAVVTGQDALTCPADIMDT